MLLPSPRRGPSDLRDPHLPERLDGEVLEAADVDGALLARLQVAPAHAKVGGGADLWEKVSMLQNIMIFLCSTHHSTG